jgi:hypothetical protein
MTIKEISILFGGLVFMTIGILASRHYTWKKIKTYIPIALGLFLIYISTVGPLSESDKRVTEITTIDSTKVKTITFQPTRASSYKKLTTFKENIVVIDRNSINEICNTLHKAKVAGEGFMKTPKEAYRVEIHFVDNKIIRFGVRKSGSTTCICLNSNDESGWHYANLDASDFGKLLNNDNN